jgi:ferric-dicitrate binding protein FerR (iron transport regulator)
MKNFQDFQLIDFLVDESFNRWARQASPPEEQTFWQHWLLQYPDKQDLADQASQLITGLRVKPYREIKEQALQQQVQHIRQHTHQHSPRGTQLVNSLGWWIRAAAVLLLVVGIGWSVAVFRRLSQQTSYTQLIEESPVRLVEKINSTNAPLVVRLPDSSRATLKPGSHISFGERFSGAKREVYLTGEAFFDVRKNPKKPFYVHANEVVTKVLGTSFTVMAYENQANVQVAVRTGRVSVYARSDWERAEKEVNNDVPGVVLTPNQKVVFNRRKSDFHRTIMPDAIIINQRFASGDFLYDETPVTKIFTELEEAYGVDIVFDEQVLRPCTLTAKFTNEPLLEKLNLICQTINASYQIVDAQIIISAQGCH